MSKPPPGFTVVRKQANITFVVMNVRELTDNEKGIIDRAIVLYSHPVTVGSREDKLAAILKVAEKAGKASIRVYLEGKIAEANKIIATNIEKELRPDELLRTDAENRIRDMQHVIKDLDKEQNQGQGR